MTQAFIEGKRVPLTVLTVEPHVVIKAKNVETDGYVAQIIGIGAVADKKVQKTVLGQLKKLGSTILPRLIREIKTDEVIEPGTVLNLSEILVPGTIVQVTAKSKGKGTSGVMKRWGMHGGPRTHGQSDRARAPGSIGRGTTPGRILPGKHMAGRMGNANMSVKNLKVLSFDAETNKLSLSGAIPGGRGALARITITKLPK